MDLIPKNLQQGPCTATTLQSSNVQLKCKTDYTIRKEIGEGSFSIVYAAVEKEEPYREVAIKMCMKKQIIKQKRVDAVHREKRLLANLSLPENRNPFIIVLYATFQDTEHLYFVTSLAKYGDLLHMMLKQPGKYFNKNCSLFYSTEILYALQHLHKLHILHRDLKPENILVAESGHIFISDFGVAKDLTEIPKSSQENRTRRSSFVGTAQYVSPEILDGEVQTTSTDLWSFGVIIYQLLTGKHCFHDESEYLIFKRIQKVLYNFPNDFPADARDLVEKLLVRKPSLRLGSQENGGPEAIRNHYFFQGVEWENLENRQPPILI